MTSSEEKEKSRFGVFAATITLCALYAVAALGVLFVVLRSGNDVVKSLMPGIMTFAGGVIFVVVLMLVWVFTYDTGVRLPPVDPTCPDGYSASIEDGVPYCKLTGVTRPSLLTDDVLPGTSLPQNLAGVTLSCSNLDMDIVTGLEAHATEKGFSRNRARCEIKSRCEIDSWSAANCV